MASSQKLIPPGYTFINNMTFVSCKTADAVKDYLARLDKRDPDLFNMYIYNDFFNYAQLDMVDKQLSAIHSKIVKKEWTEAYHLLETLSVFMELASLDWPIVDDGERVGLTDKVYGASLVTVLRALKKENRLDIEHFPGLETFLEAGAAWGAVMNGLGTGHYHRVLSGIGKRLFKDKSAEIIALEKARVEEWILTLPADAQAEIKETRARGPGDDEEDEDEGNGEPWFEVEGADENYNNRDFTLSRVWKEYKGYLQTCPTKPLRGPPEWDLSKWSEADRAPFSFGNMD